MVALITGEVKLFEFVSNAFPPEEAAYQLMDSPLPGVAAIVTVPVPHPEPPIASGADGYAITEAITGVLDPETQAVEVLLDAA